MKKRIIAKSYRNKGGLDDQYTLYDDGTVTHEYDITHNIGASGYNKSLSSVAVKLNEDVKEKLFRDAKIIDKALAKQLLGL